MVITLAGHTFIGCCRGCTPPGTVKMKRFAFFALFACCVVFTIAGHFLKKKTKKKGLRLFNKVGDLTKFNMKQV